MKPKNETAIPWVKGQIVKPEMVERAKTLRREQTPEEKILWNTLRNNQLDGLHFRRQQIVAGYIVDFYCHAAKLVIELDGGVHNNQVEYDHERDEKLLSLGLTILRFPNQQVRSSLEKVIETIRNTCHESPQVTPPSLQGRGPGG